LEFVRLLTVQQVYDVTFFKYAYLCCTKSYSHKYQLRYGNMEHGLMEKRKKKLHAHLIVKYMLFALKHTAISSLLQCSWRETR